MSAIVTVGRRMKCVEFLKTEPTELEAANTYHVIAAAIFFHIVAATRAVFPLGAVQLAEVLYLAFFYFFQLLEIRYHLFAKSRKMAFLQTQVADG